MNTPEEASKSNRHFNIMVQLANVPAWLTLSNEMRGKLEEILITAESFTTVIPPLASNQECLTYHCHQMSWLQVSPSQQRTCSSRIPTIIILYIIQDTLALFALSTLIDPIYIKYYAMTTTSIFFHILINIIGNFL